MYVVRRPIVLLVLLSSSTPAWAGMPGVEVRLTDLGQMRLESISFFLLCWLASAAVVRWIWNGQRVTFPNLPAMTYGRACGFLAIWGFLAVLVLTMISGARELLTPGAWEKKGSTYKLVNESPAAIEKEKSDLASRRQKLETLRTVLWAYAASHNGNLPESTFITDIAQELWTFDETSGAQFVCVPGRKANVGALPAVIEPRVHKDNQFVLLTNGEIRQMSSQEIARLWDLKSN